MLTLSRHMISLVSQVQKDGGFQLYSSAPAAITAVLPTSTTYNQGAVLPLAVDTAATGLYDSADKGCLALDYPSLSPKPSGKTIVVWGGSSSVGALATQLATASGAKVVAVASEHNFDFCKKCGASEVVSYKSSDVVEEVRSAVKKVGGTFVGVYDAISTQDDSYKFTIPILEALGGGNLATVLPGPEKVPSSVKTGAVFAINPVTHALWKDYVTPALEQGKLLCLPEPMVVGKGLESVQKGCDTNKKGVSAKKVVIEL